MAERTIFLGDVRKGDSLQIPVDHFGSWTPLYYDVIDNNTREILKPDQELLPPDTDSGLDPMLSFIDIPIQDEFDTEDQRSLTWVEGRRYSILVKSQAGEAPTDAPNAWIVTFRVEPGPGPHVHFLGTVEKGKTFRFMHREEGRDELWYDVIDPEDGAQVISNQDMVAPSSSPGNRLWRGSFDTSSTDDYVVGRTYFIRVKDKRADDPDGDWVYSFTVLPPLEAQLKRLLALGGENVVFDNFTYDQAGNILGLRVRMFSNATDADNATEGVTDPEPGEIASLVVSQDHDIPRNVRTFHKSILEFLSTETPGEG